MREPRGTYAKPPPVVAPPSRIKRVVLTREALAVAQEQYEYWAGIGLSNQEMLAHFGIDTDAVVFRMSVIETLAWAWQDTIAPRSREVDEAQRLRMAHRRQAPPRSKRRLPSGRIVYLPGVRA